MELDVALVVVGGLVFLGLIGVHAFRYYTGHASSSIRLQLSQEHAAQLQIKDHEIERLATAVHNWKYRYQTQKRGYSFDPEEGEYLDEEDADPENADKLSEFAKVLYPKLPPAIARIIDDDNFQEAVVKTAQKNSSGIASLLERFLKPSSEQGSASNTPKLKEVYG